MNEESALSGIQSTIQSSIEELDDLMFSLLRERSAKAVQRPQWDRTLVQARRALEKAIRLIESVDFEDDGS